MRKGIYEILGKNINLANEYEKIYDMFINDYIIKLHSHRYSWSDFFEKYIGEWKYRGIYTSVEEILDDLELSETCDSNNEIEELLLLIDFVLNACEFVKYKEKQHSKEYFELDNKNIGLIFIENNMLLENIEIILKKLGYKKVKKETYKIMLMKDKADPINTAIIVEDENIANLILDYNDFRIENDLSAKKDILNSLGQYIEPFRKKIKSANSSLEDYIFFCLNKLHIRHNNKSGKDKINYVSTMKKKELIKWYDKVYDLILIAIRLIEIPNSFKEFKELKSKILDDVEVKN